MGTFTLLFTDIEGSTRLWDTHPEAMRSALSIHDELLRKAVDAAGGRLFKHTGDGSVSVFAVASDALEAAAEIQRRLAMMTFSDIGELRVRMGVHTGEVEERDGDFFGPPMNRTARLMSAAHGGQVLVSLVTERLAGAVAGISLQDLGEHRLRDLAKPERIYQLMSDGLTSSFPELRSPDLVPNNLPTLATSFVGRDQELAEAEKLLRGARLVTITGVGGAGKTRIALQLAAEMGSAFPGGMWLIELAAVTDPDHIDSVSAQALGVAEESGRSLRQSILGFLEGREALLIVDNCEHLVAAAADLIHDILAHASSCKLIATSRELLGVGGEVAFGLRSLSVPRAGEEIRPETIGRYDAVRLFLERAAAAKPDYRMTSKDAEAVAEICRRLDGMPLALELAAARLRSFSPTQIADNLDQRFRLLTGGSRTALPRQQTLVAAIDWSYRLLAPAEKALFERLSVFQGGFSLESAMDVCQDDGTLDSFTILELLPALVDKSLITADMEGESAGYRLLETIRQFARERLDESGAGDAYRRRHAEHFLELAREAGRNIRGPDELLWWERIDTELDNLRQAMTWGLESDQPLIALQIAEAFWRFWWFKSTWGEGVSWLQQAVAAVGENAPKLARAEGLLGLGSLKGWADPAGDPVDLLQRAVDLYRELDAEGTPAELLVRGYSAALINLSVAIETNVGDQQMVNDLNEEALVVSRRLGDRSGEAVALGNLAESASREGDAERTRALFGDALAASEALQSRQRLVEQYWQVGASELKFGDPVRARAAFQSALEQAVAGKLSEPAQITRAWLPVCDFDEGVDWRIADFVEQVRGALEMPGTRDSLFFRGPMTVFRADMELQRGAPDVAARLLGVSAALEDGGVLLGHELVGRRERVTDSAKAALGDRYASLFEEGRGMDGNAVNALLSSDS